MKNYLAKFALLMLILGTVQYDFCMSGPVTWAAPVSVTVSPQAGTASFTYDHSKTFHSACPTATSGNNCVTGWEFGERDLATSQFELLGTVPATPGSTSATEAYSFPYTPSGIGIQLQVQPVGRSRNGAVTKGSTGGINFVHDAVQNLKIN